LYAFREYRRVSRDRLGLLGRLLRRHYCRGWRQGAEGGTKRARRNDRQAGVLRVKLEFVSDSLGGHDGWLTLEQEEALLNSLEGLENSVALPQGVMPSAAAEYQPQAI